MIFMKLLLGIVLAATFVDNILGQAPGSGGSGGGSGGSFGGGMPDMSDKSWRDWSPRPDMGGHYPSDIGRSWPDMDGRTRPDIGGLSRPDMGGHYPSDVGHIRPDLGDQDMTRHGMSGGPAQDVCNSAKLDSYQGSARKLSEAEKVTIGNVLKQTARFDTLMDFICYIPPACVRQINMNSTLDSSTLNSSAVVNTICQCPDNREVMAALTRRLSQADICTNVVTKVLEKSSGSNCELGPRGKAFFTRMAQDYNCVSIPLKDKLQWSSQQLRASLNNASDTELRSFASTLAQSPFDVLALPCDNIKVVMDAFATRVIKSNWTALADFFGIAPFLPESVCQQIDIGVLTRYQGWKNLQWYCSDESDDRWDFTRSPSASGGMSSGSSYRMEDMGHRASKRREHETLKKCSFTCGRVLAQKVLSQEKPSSDQLNQRLGNLQQCLDERTMIDTIQPGMCKDIPQPKNPRFRRLVSSKCKPHKHASQLTPDDVKNLGCRITDVLGKSDLKHIPDATLCDSSVLKEFGARCSSSRDLSMTMAKKCVKGQLDSSLAANLGPAVTEVKCDLLKNADPTTKNVIRQNILGGVDKSNPAKMACMKDVIDTMPITDKIKSKAIMETMTCTSAAQQSRTKRTDILNGNTDPAYTHQQKSSVLKEFMNGRKLSDLTIDEMKQYRNLVEGAKPDSMSQIPAGRKQDAMKLLGMYDGWDGKQVDEIIGSYIESLRDLNPGNPLAELLPEDVDQLSDTCLFGLRSVIRNMTSQTGRAVCSRLGSAEELTRFVCRENRTRLAYDCWNAIGNTTLSEDDIEYLGNLLPELGKELLDKIPATVMKKTGDRFSRISCMRKNVTDYIQNKINSVTRNSDTDIPAGVWAARSSANKTALLENLDAIQQANRRTVNDEYCDKEPMSVEERNAIRQAAQDVFNAIRELANTPTDAGSRRKRATTSESCSVLDSDDYRDKLYLMSPESIRDVSDFGDCVAAFGMTEGWNSDQLDALWDQFKNAMNNTPVCDLTSDQLIDMGTIGYAMSVSDIDCLKNLDTDALGALGSKSGWTTDQENAMMKTYMRLNNMNSPASLSADELAAAGHFLCGLSADDIDKIDRTAYKDVSKTLGNIVKTCDQEALQALFKVATDQSVFGTVDSWESALYGDVCIVSAGMSPDDVRQLNSEDIRYLCNDAIKAMTRDHFQKWTKAQLTALTTEQTYYLDASELTDEQLSWVIEDNDTASDAGVAVFSLISLCLSLFVGLLL